MHSKFFNIVFIHIVVLFSLCSTCEDSIDNEKELVKIFRKISLEIKANNSGVEIDLDSLIKNVNYSSTIEKDVLLGVKIFQIEQSKDVSIHENIKRLNELEKDVIHSSSKYNLYLYNTVQARLNMNLKNFEIAFDYYLESYRSIEELEEVYSVEIGLLMYRIAHIAEFYIKDPSQSRITYRKAYKFNMKYKQYNNALLIMYNLGSKFSLFEESINLDSALICYNLADKLFEKYDSNNKFISKEIEGAKMNVFSLLNQKDSVDKAYLKLKKKYAKGFFNKDQIIIIHLYALKSYIELGELKKAQNINEELKKVIVYECRSRYINSLLIKQQIRLLKFENKQILVKKKLIDLFEITTNCGSLNSYFYDEGIKALNQLIEIDRANDNYAELNKWLSEKIELEKNNTYGEEAFVKQIEFITKKDLRSKRKVIEDKKSEVQNNKLVIISVSLISLLMFFLIYRVFSLFKTIKSKESILSEKKDVLRKNNWVISRQNIRMKKLINALEESNENLSNFAHIAAHDLKTPLINIKRVAEFIFSSRDERAWNGEQNKLFEFLFSSTYNLRSLVDGLLTFSELSKVNTSLTELELSSIIKKVKLGFEPEFEKIEYSFHMFEECISILGRKDFVENLFSNLFSNSIKFRDPNRMLNISISAKRMDDGKVEICFKDNGIGISKSKLDLVFKIFKKFHRTDDITGYGIGLAICKKIVQNLGGEISVQSEEKVGTSVLIILSTNDIK